MPDREQTQRLQRKVRDRSVVLLIVGAVLLLPPVGSISLIEGSLAGLPIPVVYVFAVWALLIAAAAPAISRRVVETKRRTIPTSLMESKALALFNSARPAVATHDC